MAILAAIAGVLAACGAGPGAKAQPDPVKIKDVIFEKVGADDVKIPLGDKFSGSELTYTAESSDPSAATVAVDNAKDVLTVTAVGAGEATITVTAADSKDRTASQTFKVTVKPTTSEPEPGAPTVKDGAPTSVDFEAGESTTKTVTLSQVFEGDDLTYSAPESDDTDVAIASISNRVLIIRAGDPGEATITVTATNAKGEAEHEITVTVPEPEEDGEGGDDPGDQATQPSTTCKYPPAVRVTINLGRTKQCTIPKLHTLNPDSDGVSVREDLSDKTGMVWLVTANNKGTHDITVYDAGRPLAGKITVVVPNSLPYRKATVDPTINLLTGTNHSRITSSISLTLHSYFADPDTGDTSPFIYRIVDQPKWVLIETKDGFLVTYQTTDATEIKSATTGLTMEVLNEMKADSTFTVSLVASDGSDESELPVVLTFKADDGLMLPRMVMDYMSTQTENGALGKTALRVGPRRGVPHTLTFKQSGDVAGFKFVDEATLNTSLLTGKAVTGTASLFYKTGSAIRNAAGGSLPKHGDNDWASGYHYYVLESSGAVEEPRWVTTSLAVSPQVTFKLKESGSSGSITISYYVVYGTSADPPIAATSATRIGGKSLSVTVVTCNSPPDPIDDCK